MSKTKDFESNQTKVIGEVIGSDREFTDCAIKMAASAKQEILILCGTDNDFTLIESCGLLSSFKDIAKVGVKARFLIPGLSMQKDLGISHLPEMAVKIKALDDSLRSEISLIIVDRKELLLWKSDMVNSDDNVMLRDSAALYLDADVIVTSYWRIFEGLWHHIDEDNEVRRSRNELAQMAAESELLFSSLAESNKDLLAANERLADNDQMQREFINVAAHELRTPIQPILIAANIIESMFEDGKEKVEITKDEIDMIIRNAKRLERLSAEVLEVARIESHSFTLNKELLRLNDIIQNAVRDIKSRIEDQNDSLRLECHTGKEVYLYADKERINEVILNLLDNAIKFTRQGVVSINSTIERNEIIIQVRDTGTGIDPQIYEKLFTKFATKSERGTGLGLYISKKIIEAHGGKIWGENNKNAAGATFTVTLPLS